MGAPPAVPTRLAGQRVSDSYLGDLADYLAFVGNPPSVSAYRDVEGTIPGGGVDTLLGLAGEEWDTDGMHSVAGGENSKITIKTDGIYHVNAFARFLSDSAGFRRLTIRQNADGSPTGGSFLSSDTRDASPSQITTLSVIFDKHFSTDDVIQMFVAQNSGGSLGVDPGIRKVGLQVRWVGTGTE